MKKNRITGDFIMLFVTIIWGGSSSFSKYALAELGEFQLIFQRFLIGFLVSFLFCIPLIKKINTKILIHSCILGCLLFVTFTAMNFGVSNTSASNSGFFMSLSVLFIPIFNSVLKKKFPEKRIVMGIFITILGIAMICLKDQMSITFGIGDFYSLLCAFIYGIHIMVMEHYTQKDNPLLLGVFQLLICSLLGLCATLLFEKPTVIQSFSGLISLVFIGVFCSGMGFILQSVAQTKTDSTHIGLIYSAMPAFVVIYAAILLQEKITFLEITGIIVVILGIITVEYPSKISKTFNNTP